MDCQICFNQYDHSKHKPYSLSSCPHTFCACCLVKVKKCPICNKIYKEMHPNLALLAFIPESEYDKARNDLELKLKDVDTLKLELKSLSQIKTQDYAARIDLVKKEINEKAKQLIQSILSNQKRLLDEADCLKAGFDYFLGYNLNVNYLVDLKLDEFNSCLIKNETNQEDLLNLNAELQKYKNDLNETSEKVAQLAEEVKFNSTDSLDIGELKYQDRSCNEYCELGQFLTLHGRYNSAVFYFDKAIKMNPTNDNLVEIYIRKGKALKSIKQYESALECYTHALELDIKNHYLHFKKAQLLFLLNRNDYAIDCLITAIELNPENSFYLNYKEQVLNNTNFKKSPKLDLEYED